MLVKKDSELLFSQNDWKCKKCKKNDPSGMYNTTVGWLCDSHYNELDKIVSDFMKERV